MMVADQLVDITFDVVESDMQLLKGTYNSEYSTSYKKKVAIKLHRFINHLKFGFMEETLSGFKNWMTSFYTF